MRFDLDIFQKNVYEEHIQLADLWGQVCQQLQLSELSESCKVPEATGLLSDLQLCLYQFLVGLES